MPAELSQDQKNVQHAMVAMVENHLHWWVRWLSKYHHDDGANKDDIYDDIALVILKVVLLSYLLL